jgi:hypothetical protein
MNRRLGWLRLIPAALLVAACAAAPAQVTTTMPAAVTDTAPDCISGTDAVAAATQALAAIDRGAISLETVRTQVGALQVRLQQRADLTSDDVVQERLQSLADTLRAFVVAAGDRSTSAYQDVRADLLGQLAGFASTCFLRNGGFDADVSGWAPLGAASALGRASTAHSGAAALRVRNASAGAATVGVTDITATVAVTRRGTFRVSAWVRAETAAPTVTLRVQELAGKTVVGSLSQVLATTSAWAPVTMDYRPVRRDTTLRVILSGANVSAGAGFLVDDMSVVRR